MSLQFRSHRPVARGSMRIEVNDRQRDKERVQGGVVLLTAMALVGPVTKLGERYSRDPDLIDRVLPKPRENRRRLPADKENADVRVEKVSHSNMAPRR